MKNALSLVSLTIAAPVAGRAMSFIPEARSGTSEVSRTVALATYRNDTVMSSIPTTSHIGRTIPWIGYPKALPMVRSRRRVAFWLSTESIVDPSSV